MPLADIRDSFPHGVLVYNHGGSACGIVRSWELDDLGNALLVVRHKGRDERWLASLCSRKSPAVLAVEERVAAERDADRVTAAECGVPPFSKKDTTKAPMNQLLQFEQALPELARLLKQGEIVKHYKFRGFMGTDKEELRNAALRHSFQTGFGGDAVDEETKALHALAAAANWLMYAEHLLANA